MSSDLFSGLALVVFRPVNWPMGLRPGVSEMHDVLLLVGTKRRGPKQPIQPLPDDLRDDGPPLYANVPPFVLHEAAVRNAAPILMPLIALEQGQHVQMGRNYAGRLDDEGFGHDSQYRLSRLVDERFFRSEQRYFNLFAVHDDFMMSFDTAAGN